MTNRGERTLWVLIGFGVAVVLAGGVYLVARVVGGDSAEKSPTSTSSARRPTTTTTTTTTSGAQPGRSSKAKVEDETIQQGVFQRQYLVLSPKGARAKDKLPVVIALHGLGTDRYAMAAAAPWDEAVNADRFIAVFPQGTLNSWNAGPCCPPSNLVGTDDLSFLDQVVAEVKKRPDVDPDRLYLTGFSNGGIMTYAEICARPDVFKKAAPMAGTNLTGCAPKKPISLLHMHGNPDPVVPYDGQFVLSQLIVSAKFPPVPQSVAAWAAADGCGTDPKITKPTSGVERRLWSDCRDGTEVELLTYPGNGHSWPTKPVDGLDEMLRFFDIRK